MVSEPVSKVPVEVANVNSKSETVKSKRQVQKEKAQKPKSKKSGEKSQLVALLLCLFLGELGIHRFYLGYTGIGIIQLLTLGGFGVWALIDLIMIITGDLKPKNGDYDKTFN
ncbi:MAG: NINE protein [Bacteroidetes bacterium]|nr:NINE protein [Bacteroidota bacterium]